MTPKPRLLFVSHEMTLSGAPIQLAYLVQWLRVDGWDATVVAPEIGPLTAMLEGVEILYESQLLIDPAYGALRRLALQFDCVIANTVATWEAVQAANFEHVPVLWYIHETQVGLQLMQLIHMIEPSLALADAIVTPTAKTAAIYQRFPAKREIEVIPYGIPMVKAMAHERDAGAIKCVTLGTFERRKGQDVLLEAIGKLEPSLSSRIAFTLAGRPLEERFFGNLCLTSERLRNVRVLGALDHGEAMALLASSDVLILPSRDETMPIVLLEAMSLGKAIVATRVGGIEEWINDGVNGLLVPSDDAAALSAAIERLMIDRSLIDQLGRAARETFERCFTLERYGAQFARVITETIQGHGVRAA